MTIQVQQADRLSIKQMEEFWQGSRRMEFRLEDRAEVYQLIERVLSHRYSLPQAGGEQLAIPARS